MIARDKDAYVLVPAGDAVVRIVCGAGMARICVLSPVRVGIGPRVAERERAQDLFIRDATRSIAQTAYDI